MPETASRVDPVKRASSRLLLERMKQFAVRLKTNARWMKQFLHGAK